MARLTDFDPKWLISDDKRVGFTFVSPVNAKWRQSCLLAPTPHDVQEELFDRAAVQGCDPKFGWTIHGGIENANFETMTVNPSLDGSRGGLWHGSITNGEMT